MLDNQGAPALASATNYPKLCGNVIGGYVLARQALASASRDPAEAETQALLMRFYASRILGAADALADIIEDGAGDLERMSAETLVG